MKIKLKNKFLNKIFKFRVLNTFAALLAIIIALYLIIYWDFFKNSYEFLNIFFQYFLIIIFCFSLDFGLVYFLKNKKSIVIIELIVVLLVIYYIIYT